MCKKLSVQVLKSLTVILAERVNNLLIESQFSDAPESDRGWRAMVG
jgi:hypothetical protein